MDAANVVSLLSVIIEIMFQKFTITLTTIQIIKQLNQAFGPYENQIAFNFTSDKNYLHNFIANDGVDIVAENYSTNYCWYNQ